MGFRTVVVLSNDRADEWQNDPALGRNIFLAAGMQSYGGEGRERARIQLPYGEIVEQVHGDTQTVAFLDGYGGKAIAHSHWYSNQLPEQRDVELLKALADTLGYRISKKPVKTV